MAEESRKKLGSCGYCQEVGAVFEEEDALGYPTFVVCLRCITQVFIGLEMDELRMSSKDRTHIKWWIDRSDNNP